MWPDEPFLNLRQTATPKGTPANGGNLLYIKSDGKVYTKNSSGVEVQVGDVTLTGTQTLTNKTLTTPRIDQIQDTGGRPILNLLPSGLAVNNYLEVRNANGTSPALAAVGSNTNVNLNLVSKGTGAVLANGVAVADISTAQTVTNKTLSTGTLVGAATTDISGAWASYTPTLTNITLGSGTLTGRYMQVGKTVHFSASFTLGTGSAIGSSAALSLPVAPQNANFRLPFTAHYYDAGVANYAGIAIKDTPADNRITFIYNNGILTSTLPFTWGTGDAIFVTGTYEAA